MRAWIVSEAQRIGDTCRWSLQGWQSAWLREKSLRQWAVVNGVSAALAFTLDLTGGERAIVLALGLLVLAAELLNTAIEEAIDYISSERDPRAKRAKDCGSAAVALTALAGAAAWLCILAG